MFEIPLIIRVSELNLIFVVSTIDLEKFDFRGRWSFSNTIYPTEINFIGILSKLIKYHGRKLTIQEVNNQNFEFYQSIGNITNYRTFLSQYSTVIHMWGLYYIDSNGIFLITPLALQFLKGEIDYVTMNLIFSARTQFPKPQVHRQPGGPLRPVISLIRVLKSLAMKGKMDKLSVFEINLFWCYITNDRDVESFVIDLLAYRNNNSLISADSVSNKSPSNGVSGMLRIATMANIIEKQKGYYQLVKK